jgi:hypothetical protein
MPPRDAGPPPPPAGGPPLPKPAAGQAGLLADIRGGAKLKRVSSQEKRDRSAAAVPGGEPASTPSGAPATPGGEAGLAGALASALAARKAKVSHSGKYIRVHHIGIGFMLIGWQMMSRIKMTGR